jgi:gamma-glutamyltranspeptidase/glutathione hydrolase
MMDEAYDSYRLSRANTSGEVSTARGRGAVSCVSGQAAEAALQVLRSGGNAFDAAFTLAFALTVYHPQAGNIGGGGYLLYTRPGWTVPGVLSYRESAPAGAARGRFVDRDGAADPSVTAFGPPSACTPGTVRAFFTLQERHGSMRARDLLLAVAERAREGCVITGYQAACLNRLAPKLSASPEARAVYTKPGGAFRSGDLIRNENLARTLEILAREGAEAFYRGRIADAMERDLTGNGGFLTVEDLQAYRVREPGPLGLELDGQTVWTVPPEGGGALLLEMLNVLRDPGFTGQEPFSPGYHHWIAQAGKLAFIDRLFYLGDEDLGDNQVYRSLLSGSYGRRLAGMIDPRRDRRTGEYLRDLERPGYEQLLQDREGGETTHFCVVDAEGNAVSSSYTLNLRYGSKWAVAGQGFLINGSVDAFAFQPGRSNYFHVIGSHPNLFAPGKRPASNMAPVMVTGKQGVQMLLGTPGGPTIPTTLAAVLRPLLGKPPAGGRPDPASLVRMERLHHQGWPDVLYHEPGTGLGRLLDRMRDMGYRVRERAEPISDVHGIFRQDGEWLAVSDFRREGQAAAL